MEQILIAAAGMFAGGVVVWTLMEFLAVRPLEKHLRAAHDSQDDVVSMWADYRLAAEAEQVRLAERVKDSEGDVEALMLHSDLAEARIQHHVRKRQESQRALDLALTFYGRQLDRAEAAELELQRERIVSDGLEALLGVESAA